MHYADQHLGRLTDPLLKSGAPRNYTQSVAPEIWVAKVIYRVEMRYLQLRFRNIRIVYGSTFTWAIFGSLYLIQTLFGDEAPHSSWRGRCPITVATMRTGD